MKTRAILRGVGDFVVPLVVCAVLFLPDRVAFAAPDTLAFETRQIVDPQFGGAVAGTVYMPKGWKFEGRAVWNYQNNAEPAFVGFSVNSPAGDAGFTMTGPHAALCYFSQSPSSGNEARQLGRLLVPPMSTEDLTQMTLQNDRAMTDLRIQKVDKLDGNAAAREQMRRENIAQFGGIAGMTDCQIDESLSYVTFTKGGVAWEAMIYNSARYYYGNGTYGQYCAWDTGPTLFFQAHAGKLESYAGILMAICAQSRIDPVWIQAMQNVGNQIVQKQIADAHVAAMEAQRAAQVAYAQSNSRRDSLKNRDDALHRTARGWTNAVTDTDTWSGGGESYSAPSGYDYGWSDSNGQTVYTNDSTFNPNHSSNFSGDWSQMQKVPW